ncbi:CPBP family intramembrane glutamic endopeptidase [Nonomuraea sp. NPDC046570]|uniref:CPBP family intramembrane glutamic endopeptidase n=1 Tax=Nonomuraea sp. NPDC046570 TaxID=3155255 RepID=UPI0033C8AD58
MFTALTVLLLIHLVLLSPLLGRRTYRRLLRTRDGDPRAYARTSAGWIAELWAIAAVAVLIFALSPVLDLADVGFGVSPDDLSTLAGAAVGLTVVVLGLGLLMRRLPAPPTQDAFQGLLPRTTAERGFALLLAVSAGVCEEIVYRGLLIALGVHVLGLSTEIAAALALAVFVLGHLYQGWKGMIMVTLAGFGLTVLYLRTGNLVLPIVVHILIDIRSLLLAPASRRSGVGSIATVKR